MNWNDRCALCHYTRAVHVSNGQPYPNCCSKFIEPLPQAKDCDCAGHRYGLDKRYIPHTSECKSLSPLETFVRNTEPVSSK